MSNTSAEYKWQIVVQNIEEIESRIDLENRTTDLYDPKFCYPDNDGCSQNIGKFLPMKKLIGIQLVFKSNCTSINKKLYKLEVYLQSRKIKSNTFAPLQKVFLPPSKTIILKKSNTLFPMKNKDICDNDPRCIISCGLMVDDIIMYHIKRTQSSQGYKQVHDFVFTKMDTNMIYIYTGGHSKIYIGKKELMSV